MPHHVGIIVDLLNTTELGNATSQHTNIYHSNNMRNVDATDSEDCVRLAKVVVCVSVLLIVLCPRMWFRSSYGHRS